MAIVHEAEDVELGRPVAVKLLAENLAYDSAVRERLLREARSAARLSHPNVVRIYDTGEEDGRPYIVMELVDGESLAELVHREGPLPPEKAVELILQACAGLEAAHRAGLVHRDVKPGNLLLSRDGVLKIADFGIARAHDATRLTLTGTVLGTAAYLAPEQALGEEVTAAADVYALGAVLYELLTGVPPRKGETFAAALAAHAEPVTPVRDLNAEVPPAIESVVMRSLARLPEFRPSSAAELARQLRGTTAVSTAIDVGVHSHHFSEGRRGRRLFVAAVIAALAALGLGLGFGLSSGGSSHHRPKPAAQPGPPLARGTPTQQARSLAQWLRANAR
jgi:serine/threonine-protein kinase